MKKKVAIVTDSTATIPPEWLTKYEIKFAASLVLWDGEELRDTVDLSAEDFFTRLGKSSSHPTTSQPTPMDFKNIYSDLLRQGYDILSILLSSKLSGTLSSAHQAKEMIGVDNIEIIDSLSISFGEGWPVLLAVEAAQQGKNLAECKKIAEKACQHTGVYLTVSTLKFLHRGGRIGGAQRFLGSALRMKPILMVDQGAVEAVEKIRTRKKALRRLVDIVVEEVKGKENIHMAFLHANALEDAQLVMEMTKEKIDITKSIFSAVAPTIGTHTGPGTVGIAYLAGYTP